MFVTWLSEETHQLLVGVEMALALVTALSLLFLSAPYGRHARSGWGPSVPHRIAWIAMESPTLLVFVPLYFMGRQAEQLVPILFLLLWLSHYGYRTLVYPFRLASGARPWPLAIVLMGALFNSLNALVLAPWFSEFGRYESDWLRHPCFILGVIIFFLGMGMNRQSDAILKSLRAPGETGYKIPQGGAYRWVSCPNYLGEIVQWSGFALATWSTAGLAFALFTAANVGPRALSHHRDYLRRFPDYPRNRRALIPFLL